MEAEILPLKGKYYGTEICVTDGKYDTIISVWCNADFAPSDRELENSGVTRQQYNDNSIVWEESWGNGEYSTVRARDRCEVCDSHFESQWTLDLARKIVKAINAR